MENFLFSRAACLQSEVVGIDGRLYGFSYDPYLQVAVYVYNSCFAVNSSKHLANNCSYSYDEQGGIKNGWILPPLAKSPLKN